MKTGVWVWFGSPLGSQWEPPMCVGFFNNSLLKTNEEELRDQTTGREREERRNVS